MVASASTLNSPVYTASSNHNMSASWLETLVLPSGTPVPGSRGLTFAHSVMVEVEVDQHGYYVRCGNFDEESFGATLQEAYRDFLTSLRDRCRSMSRRESRLSPRDRLVLGKLRDLMPGLMGRTTV